MPALGSIALILVAGVGSAISVGVKLYRDFTADDRELEEYLRSEENLVKRALRSTIRTSIAKAPDGVPVKIYGRVRSLSRVVFAPISGRPCVAFDVHVEQVGGQLWTTAFHERDSCEFLVEDASGRALVRMGSSRMHLVKDVTIVDEVLNAATGAAAEFLTSRGRDVTGLLRSPTRVSEGVLEDGESVLVLGIGRWEHDPDPDPEVASGYRGRSRRFVLEDHPTLRLQVSDDPEAQ